MGGQASVQNVQATKPTSSRRWILLACVVLPLMALVLPPLISIKSYQHRIVDSISRSIGRQVHISSVRFRLLPLPSFEFSNFSIQEDPAFGAEPILHSDSVTAYPRLLSMWRGKLEVSRIHFEDASLNLVRQPNVGWNFASVLVQAAHIPNAPTGQRFAGSAPRFPYIEAENARINFKQGNEKQPLSFLNSDLSVFLNSENQWELHFKAQPVRTDLNLYLADTGLLRIDGTLHRAAQLEEMPLKLNVQWSGAPLGQLSRLTLGDDINWRGGLNLEAEIEGTAQQARIYTRLKVAGLHRAEFTTARPLDLESTCRAQFQKETRSLENITCTSPVGDGGFHLTGSLQQPGTTLDSDLTLAINQIPAAQALAGLQELRSGVGAGLQATGFVNGRFHYTSQGSQPPSVSGEMALDSLTLLPADPGKPLSLGPIRLRCDTTAGVPVLLLQPVRIPMGTPTPVAVDGRFTATGFELHLSGNSTFSRLQSLRAMSWFNGGRLPGAGTPATGFGSTGTAGLELVVRGKWQVPVPDTDHPIVASNVEGSVSVKNADFTTPYLPVPLHIASAQGLFTPSQISWTNASFSLGKLEGQGTVEYPTVCPVDTQPCTTHFTVSTPSLDLGGLQSALMGGEQRSELLRQLLDRIDHKPVAWPDLSGTIQVGTLTAGKVALHDTNGTVDVHGNSLSIRSLNGRVASGNFHLTGGMKISEDQPEYKFDIQVTNAAPAALGNVFEEKWGGGSANLSAHLQLSGFQAGDLADSATGTLHWDWVKGGFAAEGPLPEDAQSLLHFDNWSGDAQIADQTITITHSLLARAEEAIPMTGTISFDRVLDLKSGSAAHSFTIKGPVQRPEIKANTEEVEK